jgi:DNA invertase Pin-like site-specific DNA recombinase
MDLTDTPNPLVRAGCYLRISSDPDDKREGVQRQREDTTALCEVKGWTPVDFYEDNNRSASNGKDRPRWDDLLADITAGKIDAIAAWDQDRNWRKMSELEDLRKFFGGLGREVKLATTGQGEIDLYSPTGVMQAQMKTIISEHEAAMMSVRQRRAAVQKAERGLPKWKLAFGYLPDTRRKEDDDGTRQIDPQTAELVKDAYAAVLASPTLSLNDIAKIFNDVKAFGLNGKPWTASTVSLFLRSPRNCGLRAHNDELVYGTGGVPVKGTWPALVDEKTWKAAQTVLNAPGRAPGRKTVRKHPLTGVMRCGKPGCDGYLAGNWVMQPTGGKSGRRRAGQPPAPSGQVKHSITYACRTCHGVSIRAEHVVPLLYGIVGGRLAMEDAVDLLKAEIHDEAEAERIRVELNALRTELRNIGVERGQRLLTGEQAKIASDLISEDIAKLERRQQDQERLRVFEGIPLGTPQAVDAVKRLTDDRFRAVVDVLATVTVTPVGKSGHVFDPERVDFHWHQPTTDRSDRKSFTPTTDTPITSKISQP